MAEVYEQPTAGGRSSPRFRAYVERMAQGQLVSGYNPMTSKDVLGTIEALLEIGAEKLCREAADAVLGRLEAEKIQITLALTVATPGVWTDRLGTEINHRLTHRCGSFGDSSWQVLLWTGEEVSVEAVVTETTAQTMRVLWAACHGMPASVGDAAAQEGLAFALTNRAGQRSPVAAEALDVLGTDPSVGTMAALLYGDGVAAQMGWTPLGLGAEEGYGHAVAQARQTLEETSLAVLLARAGR
jgi:hypothetical protein